MVSRSLATVAVEYRYIDGYHVFTSNDVYGLYVASKDPRKAYDAVAPAIQQLLSVNEGISCSVEKSLSLKQFLQALRKPGSETPEQLGPRQFVLRTAA